MRKKTDNKVNRFVIEEVLFFLFTFTDFYESGINFFVIVSGQCNIAMKLHVVLNVQTTVMFICNF